MNKPHVLVLSPHAGIADGLVRLLSLEGRYEVRKAASALDGPADWRADVVLVDGALLRNGSGVLSLPAPALVLSGSREDAEALLARVPTAKGWLRKDATYPELERALASIGVGSAPPSVRMEIDYGRGGTGTGLTRRARAFVVVAFALAFVGSAIAVYWLLFR